MNRQENKKQGIIQEGLKILYRKGYNGTGIKEITDAAGIPKGSFYTYFKSKEDFAIEAMRYFTEKELASMNRVLTDENLPPLKRIETLYAMKCEHFIQKNAFSLGCYLCNITLEMADISQSIAIAATDAFECEKQPLLRCLQEAQMAGEISSKQDIGQIADLIRNSWLGALVIMKAAKDKGPLEGFQQILQDIVLHQEHPY
jgi:TetR/AcrR family transcriptional repressor of nem operon